MANYNDLSAESIYTNLSSYESARSSFFSFIVSGLDNIVKASYGDTSVGTVPSSAKIPNAGEYLRLNVLKAKVPHFDIKAEEYRRGNDVVKFAGVPTFANGSISVQDVVGLDTKSILMAWQNLAYNVKTRKGGRMADYKKTCTLVEYTQDFEKIREWTLYGCWISGLSEGDFDKTSDGMREIDVTIEYDRAEMKSDINVIPLK